MHHFAVAYYIYFWVFSSLSGMWQIILICLIESDNFHEQINRLYFSSSLDKMNSTSNRNMTYWLLLHLFGMFYFKHLITSMYPTCIYKQNQIFKNIWSSNVLKVDNLRCGFLQTSRKHSIEVWTRCRKNIPMSSDDTRFSKLKSNITEHGRRILLVYIAQ